MEIIRLHATCVAKGTKGILFTGESGAGKSDLALRMIDRGARLVADDQLEIIRTKAGLSVSAPEKIAGLLEVRGLGIFKLKALKKVQLSLVVNLCKQEWIERLPYPKPQNYLGVDVPHIHLCGFEASAPAKIEMALKAAEDGSMTVGALRE